MWQKLSSKQVFSHPRLNLVEDEVLLNNGKPAKYLLFGPEGLEGITVIVLDENDDLLLCQDYSYAVNQKLLQFCEGALEEGETPHQAAVRELKEELGVTATSLEKIGSFLINHRRTDKRLHLFIARGITRSSQQLEDEEDVSVVTMPQTEFAHRIASGEVIQQNALCAWAIFSSLRDQ